MHVDAALQTPNPALANPLAPSWLEVPADANDLPAIVWSRNVRRTADGELEIGGMTASTLVDRFGSPVYVVDEDDARSRAAEAATAFGEAFAAIGADVKVYYAGKAFLTTAVARWMTEAGLCIDVCSGGELAVALAGGVDPARIGYHGNNKSLAEIDRAVEVGVGAIVIDSLQEIDRVAEAAERRGVRQAVRLRVNSGVHAHTHEFLATAREDQKFGLPLDAVDDAVARIRAHASLRLLGLHSHIGSQIFDAEGFRASADRMVAAHARIARDGDAPPELNLGGGYGIAYTRVDTPSSLREMAVRMAEYVAAACEREGVDVPLVAFEPGRAIIGPAGTALYTVGTTKPVVVTVDDAPVDADGERPVAARLYVSIDGGMSDNARPALYEADYSVRIASRASDAAPALVRVAGKHCESGDLVVLADYLPGDVAPGDLVAVPATGAYCWSLSSNYNLLPRPAVVAVRGGDASVLVRAETIDDLLARDGGLPARA